MMLSDVCHIYPVGRQHVPLASWMARKGC